MAVSTSFKQPCPSCEALVPIKDASLIGKKVKCPMCKYVLVVEKPAGNGDKPAADKMTTKPKEDKATRLKEDKKKTGAEPAKETEEKTKADKTGEAIKPGKPKGVNNKEAITAKGPANGAPPAKPSADGEAAAGDTPGEGEKPAGDAPDAEGTAGEGEKPKKKVPPKKLLVGLGLAGVGVAVLAAAAFFLFGNKKKPGPKASSPPLAAANTQGQPQGLTPTIKNPKGKVPKGTKDPKTKKTASQPDTPPEPEGPVSHAGPELTNLLPPDTEHVFHVFFKNVFDPRSPLREAAFGPGAFLEDEFKQRIGIPILSVDDLIRAQRFTSPSWSFTVMHLMKGVREKALVRALDLQPAKESIKNQKYYLAGRPQLWLEELGQLSLGAPEVARWLKHRENQGPLCVRLHDANTLIFADRAPMLAFLEAEGQFKYQTEEAAEKTTAPAGKPKTTIPPGTKPPPGSKPPQGTKGPAGAKPPLGVQVPATPQAGKPPDVVPSNAPSPNQPAAKPARGQTGGTYMTINPGLKAILDRMERRPARSRDRVFFSTATDMEAARLASNDPDLPRGLWQFRQVWEVTNLIRLTNPRIRLLGAGLQQKEPRVYCFKSEIHCASEENARALHRELSEQGSPILARFADRILAHQVEVPKVDKKDKGEKPPIKPNPFGPGMKPGQPFNPGFNPGFPQPGLNPKAPAEQPPEEDEAKVSRIRLKQNGETVLFRLNLVLDQVAYGNLNQVISLLMINLKNQMDLAARRDYRHRLAQAGLELGLKGLTDRGVPPGTYPPGVFKRPASSLRTAHDPNQRLSWMAGLLPYLGRKDLYDRIDFNLSWKDPGNWLVARNVIPEFIDPTYPVSSRYVAHPAFPFPIGASHFVGIAGVGMDAADYAANDAAVDRQRGVLGYEGSRGLKEVEAHGKSNTILLIQVPHDSPVGVTPWLEGGGSTLRGVPEKNSIAPFVLTTDANGQPIQYMGKRGTFALMVDGSVRFIDQNISDAVFKAMCTAKGPPPQNPLLDQWAPLVPEAKEPPKTPPKASRNEEKKGPKGSANK